MKNEVNFENELDNSDMNSSLIFEDKSAFYTPYYYKKYSNNGVLIR